MPGARLDLAFSRKARDVTIVRIPHCSIADAMRLAARR